VSELKKSEYRERARNKKNRNSQKNKTFRLGGANLLRKNAEDKIKSTTGHLVEIVEQARIEGGVFTGAGASRRHLCQTIHSAGQILVATLTSHTSEPHRNDSEAQKR